MGCTASVDTTSPVKTTKEVIYADDGPQKCHEEEKSTKSGARSTEVWWRPPRVGSKVIHVVRALTEDERAILHRKFRTRSAWRKDVRGPNTPMNARRRSYGATTSSDEDEAEGEVNAPGSVSLASSFAHTGEDEEATFE